MIRCGRMTGMVDSARHVLVVGGTSGIGGAVAAHFAARGAEVTAAGLNASAAPAGVRAVNLDVTDGTALENLVGNLDRLDVLVNAAGIIRRHEEFDPVVFARVIDINLTATMRACVAARPLLAAAGGSIVNLASMLSFFGGPLVPAYTASKGGVAQLTKSLAVAWAADGVRVNAVAPGWIRTELTAGIRENADAERRIMDRTPMKRWGEPAEVAEVVEFLAGPGARFITGVVLPVDGGYLAT